MRALVVVLALSTTAMSTACSAQYTPRTGPRISLSMKGGNLVYVRGGQEFKHGAFGGGLREAVAGNPAAEAAAEQFHDRMVTGVIGLAVSVACAGVLAFRVVDKSLDDQQELDGTDAVFLGCFLVGYAVGLQQIASGQPYMYDAINIYNDSVEGFVPRPPGGATWLPPPAPPPAPQP